MPSPTPALRASPPDLRTPPPLSYPYTHLPPQEASPPPHRRLIPKKRGQIKAIRPPCRSSTPYLSSNRRRRLQDRILLSRRVAPSNDPQRPFSSAAYHPMFFFLLFLRRTTMQHIKSITFARSCQCGAWLPLAAADRTAAWQTDGRSLEEVAFSSKLAPMTSAVDAKKLYFHICKSIMESELVGWSGMKICEDCSVFEPRNG
ncbi:hypothetical protein B0T14DRAFT_110190 [Immersiella caudata]|uniref:Uncharacterized protein n=1 Tax=Immersiella caudata TaxID=314043 RepID=A0AA39X3J2_9PEZI|nr:hypothetical protein B0T14DRAFT_110190 [Immersiella caudata]